MVLPQYDELTSEDDDGAPPFASEYDEEESREAYQRAAYREAIAHFLPLPRTSYFWSLWQERVARDRQKRVARARADYRGAIAILPANHVVISQDFVDFAPMQITRVEWRYPAEYDQAAAAIGSHDMEEIN